MEEREIVVKKKKNESLLLLGTGKIVQQQQSVCLCQRERETEKEIDKRRETEKQIFLHVYKCSVPNPKFLPTLHTSGKPQCCVFLKGQWDLTFCPLMSSR